MIPDSLLLIPDSSPPDPAAGADGVASQAALFDQGKKLTLGDLRERWNALPSVRKAQALTDARKKAFAARIKDPAWLPRVDEALSRVAASAFCQGGGEKGWVADVDWFLRPDTIATILEGKFDDRRPAAPKGANGHTPGRIHSPRFAGMGANAGNASGGQS